MTVSRIVTVLKVGTGEGTGMDAFRADTTATKWNVLEERETEFVIEILDQS